MALKEDFRMVGQFTKKIYDGAAVDLWLIEGDQGRVLPVGVAKTTEIERDRTYEVGMCVLSKVANEYGTVRVRLKALSVRDPEPVNEENFKAFAKADEIETRVKH